MIQKLLANWLKFYDRKNIDLSHLDKQSYLTIKNLIDTKTHQLGEETSSSPALASEPTPDQQHAS